jgi:hypothetical protein
MKTATVYAADVANHMEKAVSRMQPALTLAKHTQLPTTTQKITSYIDQLLTSDEQAVCDIATD